MSCITVHGQNIKALSYNIRYDATNDGVNVWENRKVGLADLLLQLKADIIGTQEGLKHQLDYIQSRLNDYKMIGIDRDKNGKGEYSSIYYNSKRLKLIKTETFWLSETPETPSIGWDAALNRVCTYGLFQVIETGKLFYAFNTHFDHRGEMARLKSAELITTKIKEINISNYPVILMGDFNSEPTNEPILTIIKSLNDGKSILKNRFVGPIGTFSGFDIEAILDRRIDYIFVKGFLVVAYKHLDKKLPNGHWPSDHLPVYAELIIN